LRDGPEISIPGDEGDAVLPAGEAEQDVMDQLKGRRSLPFGSAEAGDGPASVSPRGGSRGQDTTPSLERGDE
jgi:hypothetical protein